MSITLRQCRGKVFVWDAEDICKLREQHRVVGNLVGCLPRCPRQNIQLGVPLQLMPEETTLLLEKGIGRLVDDNGPLTVPSTDEVQSFKQYRKKSYEEQVVVCKRERHAEMLQYLPEIVTGRRNKRRKIEEKDESSEISVESSFCEGDVIKDGDIPNITEKQAMIQLFTKNPKTTQDHEVAWLHPITDEETLRYRVFKDFWERGHYLTCGAKFGGDFLVYEGDPARFHAPYIAICTDYRCTLSTQRIVTLGRLGTNVKKTPVLCSIDQNNELCFTSIQWSRLK